MAIKNSHQGFALLVAVIFMSVMLSFALALGSLSYKQTILASSALDSQYAFYAADAGLECILRLDQDQSIPGGLFEYNRVDTTGLPVAEVKCNGAVQIESSISQHTDINPNRVLFYKFNIPDNRCADVTIYKYRDLQPSGYMTYIFSRGYSVKCDNIGSVARYSVRGLQAHY